MANGAELRKLCKLLISGAGQSFGEAQEQILNVRI